MQRTRIAAAVLGAVPTLFCGVGYAHGGPYAGPGDLLPPGGNGPVPTGPAPPGPTTPGSPNGPRGTGPAPIGPNTPSGGPPAPAGGPTPQTPSLLSGPNLESWTYWWGFNRNRFLQLKAHIHKIGGPITRDTAEDVLTPFGDVRDTLAPSKAQIVTEIVPALRSALETETNRDVVTAALMALAKIGEEPEDSIAAFLRFLKSSDQEIAETAALSLGILAAPESAAPLLELYRDSEAGRALCGRPEVPWRTRAFAAYGLGLAAARAADADAAAAIQAALLDHLSATSGKRSPTRDVRLATVVALGVIPDPSRRAAAALERYLDENRATEETICAHVPTAIAKILRDGTQTERERFALRCAAELAAPQGKKQANLRPSFAMALGLVSRADDAFAPKAIAALRERIEKDPSRNWVLAYFGLIALGEIAGTGAPGGEIERFLLERAEAKGGRVLTRGWAALALGVAGFEQDRRGARGAVDPIGEALAERFAELRDPEQVGAFAIALGLRRHAPAAAEMLRTFSGRVNDDACRGYVALGLGLLEESGAVETLSAAAKVSARRPDLLRETATALGLLGDKRVVKLLTDVLAAKEHATLAVQAAVASALGAVGDRTSVDPLVKLLRDEKKELTAGSRAFAAVALGMVADKETLPWNFKLSRDLNYLANSETLMDPVGMTGVLNLL